MTRKAVFLGGLFLLSACVLVLQIVETRILSVISFYHLAFFAIIRSTGLPWACSPSSSPPASAACSAIAGQSAMRAVPWRGVDWLRSTSLCYRCGASLIGSFNAYSITVRALVAIAMILPLGLLMGFGFPTGMRLANAIDARPTPWFWAINSAAGVLAASIAVAVNIAFSIKASIWLRAGCYLLTGIVAVVLIHTPPSARRLVVAKGKPASA